MAGFSELIKSFGKTREYIRDFFVYGFKRRGDFRDRSSRTYDDEKRRAECWLGDCIRLDDSVRGRQVSISVDSAHIPENPLYQAYRAKSFTDRDIRLHFLLTDILSGTDEPLTVDEICDRLMEDYSADIGLQTVRNKLKEYTEEGIVQTISSGNKKLYALSPDTLESFTEQFPGLPEALAFFSEAPGFGIAGNTLLRAGGMKNEHFFMKHNYLMHTLEDEVLLELLTAASQKSTAVITTAGEYERYSTGEEKEVTVLPMQAAVSVQTGRRFLSAYVPEENDFRSYRLDFIREVRQGEPCGEYDRISEDYRRALHRCFGVRFDRPAGDVAPLVLTVSAGKYEDFIRQRLIREKRCGTFEEPGDGLYRLTFDVNDVDEVMRWARTLICRTVSIEGGTEALREQYADDIRRMYDMYGGDADDAVQ
ncbi:MAG: WYL domain-containing transcriptional regulator [Ruminococcus sp.]|nr:WYL domain-containing transcriptional regulator [Ruminococcus sp.]